MDHILLSLGEFAPALGSIAVFLAVLLLLGLGLAARAITQMFSEKSAQKRPARQKLGEVECLKRQLFEAQNTAYESALASEKTIQQLQQRLQALEAERVSSFISVGH